MPEIRRKTEAPDAGASYRAAALACYTANFIGALVINLTPILFIPLKTLYGLTYTEFGLLLAANYVTQVAADIIFSWPADRYGCRPFLILAPLLTIAGYLIFACSPLVLENPFPGFLLGTVVFSATGGLLELLLNVVINGIPDNRNATRLAELHSFYAWGQITVVLLTTIALWRFGAENWQWIVGAWGVIPAINFVQFLCCKLPPQIPEEKRQGANQLLRKGSFYLIIAIIVCAGMSEASMNNWTSAFLERAVRIPKIIGDTAGVCLFAAMLGSGRVLYSLLGERCDIWKLMAGGSLLAVLCYLTAALAGIPALALAGCALCGLAVSLLWPGSVILAGREFPFAGAWLYAMLAAGGDIGAAVGPYLVGVVTDCAAGLASAGEWPQLDGLSPEQFGLRSGLLLGALFPAGTFGLLLLLRRRRNWPERRSHRDTPLKMAPSHAADAGQFRRRLQTNPSQGYGTGGKDE